MFVLFYNALYRFLHKQHWWDPDQQAVVLGVVAGDAVLYLASAPASHKHTKSPADTRQYATGSRAGVPSCWASFYAILLRCNRGVILCISACYAFAFSMWSWTLRRGAVSYFATKLHIIYICKGIRCEYFVWGDVHPFVVRGILRIIQVSYAIKTQYRKKQIKGTRWAPLIAPSTWFLSRSHEFP